MRRLLAVLAILVASATSIPPSHAARTGPLDACAPTWTRTGYYGDISCSEVNRAINEAAAWWGIDEQRFRRVIRCESAFNPFANRYGLVQLTDGFWHREAPRFNAAAGPIATVRASPFHNAYVAAWVIARDAVRVRDGYAQWTCKG